MNETLFAIIRLIHILAGVLWVGAAVMLAFFVGPAAGSAGPAGGALMDQLVRVRKLPAYMASMAGLTVLAGIGLMWMHGAATDGGWMRTSSGKLFMWGALVAIVGFVWGMVMASRLAKRMTARTAALAAAGRPPTAEEQAEIRQGFARLSFHTRGAAIVLVIAAAMMAFARYI
jgi:uncharacterized membrane protein